ncbi:thrombospondin type 3 repeat-containing protein [Maribacter dokdonensis]|uniref:thrombospondin type 3 repeat-containing protein n=1 Tax=Maribacter dokdonensis TaxID=320912 RepID=UPI0027332779|nr:thrombospondin type 3 repeat-containing protein [Maribacter dokdonensis]MDP2524559.1 thrombospondin type 3 repeat-containing protein [Maribacter dokdonensis]
MKKIILIILVSIFVLNCSKDTNSSNSQVENQEESNDDSSGNENQDPDNPTTTNTIKIEVNGLDEIDYSKIQVFTPNGLSEIKNDGSFKSEFENGDIEKLPLVFIDDADKILFGYYPETIIDNKVTIDDILLFCFLNMPEVAMREVEFSDGLNFLKSDSNYESLKTSITDALNKNQDVLDDTAFIEKISATVSLYVESLETSSLTGKSFDIDDFEIIYSRDGKITIPEEAPIFSALGVEIRNSITNEFLVDDYILKSNSLVLNSTSFAHWFQEKFFSDNLTSPYKTFNLNQDGTYVVKFTNGKSFDKISEKVVEVNRQYFISTLMSYVIPKGLKQLTSESDKCIRSVNDLIINRSSDYLRFIDDGISEEELYAVVRGTIIDMGQIIVDCTSSETLKKYLGYIVERVLKLTDALKDSVELTLFTRDFFNSDIEESQVRYFDNGISYGNLKYSNVSGMKFSGQKDTNFSYEGIVEEDKINYLVQVKDKNFFKTTTFTKQKDSLPASGLPFQVVLNSGDAILNGSNPIISDENGKIILVGQLGQQDSEIEIKSLMINQNFSPTIIELKIESDSDGDGITDSIDLCPDTPSGETVDEDGCSTSQKDSDGDGINDNNDQCPNTPPGEMVDSFGCVDDWDPNNESTWAVRRDLLIGGVQMISSDQTGYSVQLSLKDDWTIIGPGGATGIWNYNGRTLNMNWSRTFLITDQDENNNPIEVPCTISGSFSGSVVNYTTADGSGSNSSSCCDENCGLQFWNGPARVSF